MRDRINLFWRALLCSLPLATASHAADIALALDNQKLALSVVGLEIPDAYRKGFGSGLENIVLIRLTVTSKNQPPQRADALVRIKRDLWDDVFLFDLLINGRISAQRTYAQLQDVLKALADLHLGDPLLLNELSLDDDFQVRAEIFVDPIDRERMERLRKWVAANSAPLPLGQPTAHGGALTSKPNDLFNRIFEQYLAGQEIAAPWSVTLTSPRLTRRQLLSEAPHP